MTVFVAPKTDREKTIQALGKEYQELLLNCRQYPLKTIENSVAKFSDLASPSRLDFPSLEFAAKRLMHIYQHGVSSINVGGTMGCGKSSLAELMAAKFGFVLKDSDYFHPESNIEKMGSGQALNDLDRYEFLKGVKDWLSEPKRITTCSALTDLYRSVISGQDPELVRDQKDPRRANPWTIERPNYGLLQILVSKPYTDALRELDHSVKVGPQRTFNKKVHFIQVTHDTEALALREGRTPLLRGQYNALEGSPAMPWDVITVDAKSYVDANGKYDGVRMMERFLNLPVAA